MSIPGQQSINIGLPNESANSDSLYTAFTKTQQNFTTLFTNSSPFNTFNAGEGIDVVANANTGVVTVTNTGVTNIVAGTNIVIDQSNGNVTISSIGGGNGGGGTVTSVGLAPVSASRLSVSGSPIVSSGTMNIDLATSGVTAGTYSNPNVTIDAYGRVTAASNGSIAGTVTSVGLTPGSGIQISGGPVTSNGNITVINTGVVRLNAGTGITLSSGNGNVTISANTSSGTVTAVAVNSSQLVVTGSPIVTSGTIGINLPNNLSIVGNIVAGANVVANRVIANAGTINGNLIVTGNISPAANGKIGGITPGPGVNVSNSGVLTIDSANLPVSFGNFYANNNVLSIVNVDQNMILQTQGNAEIQLVGNIGFYKPDGLPPNVANRYFSATSDGQITIYVPSSDPAEGAVGIIGSTSGTIQPPINTGVMLQITGQNGDQSRLYNDAIGGYSGFIGRRYNNTATSPTQVLNNDEIARLGINGYKTGGWLSIGQARISFISTDNQDNSNNGAKIDFWSTPKGNTTANIVKVLSLDATYGANVTGTLSVTGNANVGNLGTARILASANVTAPQLISNVATGTAPLVVTSTTQVANLNVATAGTVTTNAQPNITSVGTLTSVAVTGNVTAGNVYANAGTIGGSLLTGTLTTAAQPNITSVGTLTSVTTSGNVTANGAYRYNVATNNATVTQLTDKSTAVTCNGRTGQITTSNSSIAKGAAVTFTVNNTAVTSVTDVPIIAIQTGATANSYAIAVTRVQVGSFNITITNNGAGALTDTLVINFALLNVG